MLRTLGVLALALAAAPLLAHAQTDVQAQIDAYAERSLAAIASDEGLAAADSVLAVARRAGDAAGAARGLYLRALNRNMRGDAGTAPLFAAAARAARAARAPVTEGSALVWQGIAVFDAGRQEEGRVLAERGLAVQDAMGTDEGRKAALETLSVLAGGIYDRMGRTEDALRTQERIVTDALALGLPSEATFALGNIAGMRLAAGDLVGAREALRRGEASIARGRELGDYDGYDREIALGQAELDAALGRTDNAAAVYRRVLGQTQDGDGPWWTGMLYQSLGDLYLDADRPADALAAYRDGVAATPGAEALTTREALRVREAAALFALGRNAEARAALYPAAERVVASEEDPESVADALVWLARDARTQRRSAEALGLARRAVDAAEGTDNLKLRRDALAELAGALADASQADSAFVVLGRVMAIQDSLSDQDQARAVGRIEAETAFESERQAEAARRRRLGWALGGALGLAALIALAGGLYARTVRRKNAEIAAQAERLERANADLAETNGDLALANRLLGEARETQARAFHALGHEIRTPLTLAAGPAADLARGLHGDLPEPARHAATGVTRSLGRLGGLIDDLLDAARLDAGQAPHAPAPGDLAATARDTVQAFAAHAEREGVRLDAHLPTALPATFDPAAVERALGNLLANALRHTPGGGTVTVTLSAAGGAARLVVADTGPGIPPDALPTLFERFTRADERAGTGTGLGLALTREWMERHGGRVEVQNRDGGGAAFTLVLPLGNDTGDATAADAEGAPAPHAGDGVAGDGLPGGGVAGEEFDGDDAALPDDGLVVLVAEDNAEVRAYVADHLGRTGGAGFAEPVTVVTAADGRLAHDRARALVPDLVVTDVMMPHLDGVGLTRALKQDALTSHVPVLMLTARADAGGRVAGFAAGADGYLPKPFDPEALRAQAAALVTQRRALRDRILADAIGHAGDGHAGDGATDAGRSDAGRSGDGRADGALAEPPVLAPVLAPLDRAFVERVDARIAERLADAGFGATQLAGDLALSERQLRRKLKALTGETPGVRLRRRRVEAGAELLAAGTHTVKEAADAVGYADAGGFRRAFVALRGHAPSEPVA